MEPQLPEWIRLRSKLQGGGQPLDTLRQILTSHRKVALVPMVRLPVLARRLVFAGLLFASSHASWNVTPAAAAGTTTTVNSGFVIENAFPGVHFNTPTAIAFLPDGRLLVAEKRGVVWVVDGGALRPKPFWSAEREVLANGDRGLVGLAVDPHYSVNHRVYFCYAVDPDSNGVDDNPTCFSRLTRYTAGVADSNVADPSSRAVLIGATWRTGIPSGSLSHGVGALAFGSDGSLLVSHGDGGHFEFADVGGHDPSCFEPGKSDTLEDIGALRSQFLGSLAGKLLRINPETGRGYASNPYATSDLDAPQSKVWAYGFRNPFRFCIRPGTGSADTTAGNPGIAYVGDVGARTWEELDVVSTPGMNFGWPLREGDDPYALLADVIPGQHGGWNSNNASLPAAPTDPRFVWNHTDSTRSRPFGIRGNCTSGGVFYTGTRYPPAYRGRLFFGDFGGGWLRVATLDDTQRILSMQSFATGLQGPVDWAIDPVSSEILYVSIYTGEVRRIRYTGGIVSSALVARASATPTSHAAPATILFSSLGSYDTGGSGIEYTWNFGDGTTGSTAVQPAHIYPTPGEYTAILTVTREDGALARDTVNIVVLRDNRVAATPDLNAFTSEDRPLGSPWLGNLNGLSIQSHALVQTGSSNYCLWNDPFGANQEAHVRLDSISTSAPEHDLLLKVQGSSWTSGAIQVVFDATGSLIVVNTYTPGTGWTHIAGPWRNIRFNSGDVFSARALSNGLVEVYRNSGKLGDCLVDNWQFSRQGGRIGLMLKGASGSRLAAFGGGHLSVHDNIPPVASILAPAAASFYTEGRPVFLRGAGHDADDGDANLRYHWSISVQHNNHFHPDVMTSEAAVDSFIAENHDDGTGISLLVRLIVTDPRNASDTVQVVIHPGLNLAPTGLTLFPKRPTGSGPTTIAFTLANDGSMPAPRSRWRLRLDGAVVAEGDTLVGKRDSVRIERTLPPVSEAPHVVRVEADVLGETFETDETDNMLERDWLPLPFPVTPVLDTFERGVDSTVALTEPWCCGLTGLAVSQLALTQTVPAAYAVWNGTTYGPEQEAYFRFDSVTAIATEHSLLLKVQRTNWNTGAVQVAYSGTGHFVALYTYAPNAGWVRRAGPFHNVDFEAGDQLGARVSSTKLTAYRNGVAIGSGSIANWEFAGLGGHIGLLLRGAGESRLVDFGGGDVVDTATSPPHAMITFPSAGDIIAAGDTLVLRGSGSDAEDAPASLRYRWRVGFPGSALTRLGATAVCPVPADAIGRVPVRLIVTDSGGRADTASASVLVGAGVLDRFNRANGPPGPAWLGSQDVFAVRNQGLGFMGTAGYLIWNSPPFAPNQEAWMDFDSLSATAPEHDLLLKVQGPTWTAGAVQVSWSAPLRQVVLNTYSPGAGWTRRGGPWRNIEFVPGDRFGARAWADGRVVVLRNGRPVAEGSLCAWAPYANGGRIGIIFSGATATRVARFGGGAFADSISPIILVPADSPSPMSAGTDPDRFGLPDALQLSQAYPNPVRHAASFALELPRPARVGIVVYDIGGRSVWSQAPRDFPPGRGTVRWPGTDSRGGTPPLGVYLAKLTVDRASFTRRVVIIR